MASELVVRILGDSSSLEKTFRRSAVGAKRFDQQMSRSFRGVVAGSGAFRGLGRSIAFASASFLGAAGLTSVIRGAFEEMSNAQQVAAQTNAAIKSTGGVAGVTSQHVEDLGQKLLNLSGVNDEVVKSAENLLLAYTNIRNVGTGKNAIFDRATLAALDVSIRKNKQMSDVAVQLGKALQDPVRGLSLLRRSGITFTAAQEKVIKRLAESGHLLEAQKLILDSLEQKYGGAGRAAGNTLAGKLAILKENILNVEGAIATLLLPAITKVVDQLVAWVQNTDNQKRVLNDAKQAISDVSAVLDAFRSALEKVNKITGSTGESLKILFGVLVAFKTLSLASSFTKYVTEIGLIGSSATVATGEVTALRTALLGIATLGVATVAVEVIIHKKEITDFLGRHGVPFADKSGLDLIRMAFPDAVGPKWLQKKLGLDKTAKGIGDDAAKAIAKARKTVVDAIKKITDKPGFAKLPGTVPPPPPVDPKFRRQANEAARQRAVDLAGLAVDRAGLTKTLTDDLAANRRLNALLKKRIAGGHDTIALEQQQIQVEKTIADLVQQQAEARKAARSAREFKILGLGPTGQPLAPTTAALRTELSQVLATPLDKKARAMAERIRKVLKKGAEKLTTDVRDTVKQMLDDIRGGLKDANVDVTRFQKTARGQFAFAGGAPHRPVNVYVQIDGKTVAKATAPHNENELGRRHSQRAHARRGNR